ncbi:exodeoxyribonuclease VII small subunit [Rhodobacterales bacterium HKCCE3408]|nr:exodeoxyribonuclease VII small subunit [Rhodobacterales bacterium HKCCE3408]
MTDAEIEKLTFEEALKALEDVVTRLDKGEVPLEDSIKLYETGSKLKARCEAKLREAEEKVAQITLDADGRPTGTREAEGL